MNQAVMAAWKAGIVVVASAGNAGPEPMTIGAPGNVPYVITVWRHVRCLQPFRHRRRLRGVVLLGRTHHRRIRQTRDGCPPAAT